MKRKNKTLLIIGLGALAAASTATVATTYSLFSDKVEVDTHLKTATLKVTLTRVSHSYTILDETGLLKETKVETESVDSKDMSNVFELPVDALIVPGSELYAKFELSNKDQVAFDYKVEIVLVDAEGKPITETLEDNNLAEQLEVTLTNVDGTHKLSDSGLTFQSTSPLLVNGKTTFEVNIEFLDDDLINNYVMNKTVSFDIVVTATQSLSIN